MKQGLSRPNFARRSPAAFTLIELLVVILIIAVLAAVLLPALNSVLRKGYQTTSMNNLSQWFNGFTASVGDHDGEMPTPGGTPFTATNEQGWFNRMPPELKELPFSSVASLAVSARPGYGKKSIWINPAVPAKDTSSAGGFIFHYGYNDNLMDLKTGDPLRIGRLQSPHLTVLMAEKADAQPGLNKSSVRTYFNASSPTLDPAGGANFLFCDGHVELVKRSVFANDALSASDTALDRNQTTITWFAFSSDYSQ